MRAAKDHRADEIVKKELYQQILDDGFDPKIVFDDRPRVVRMWRSLGLYVFDCNQSGKEF